MLKVFARSAIVAFFKHQAQKINLILRNMILGLLWIVVHEGYRDRDISVLLQYFDFPKLFLRWTNCARFQEKEKQPGPLQVEEGCEALLWWSTQGSSWPSSSFTWTWCLSSILSLLIWPPPPASAICSSLHPDWRSRLRWLSPPERAAAFCRSVTPGEISSFRWRGDRIVIKTSNICLPSATHTKGRLQYQVKD